MAGSRPYEVRSGPLGALSEPMAGVTELILAAVPSGGKRGGDGGVLAGVP